MANPSDQTRAENLGEVVALLESGSHERESGMSVLDHHLQCAAVLRERCPDDEELQLAGLLHDIGHRLAPGQPERHGTVAAAYLEGLLNERICSLIELHVDAKRYLVAVEPTYRAELSEDSARTLIAQGEAMSADEVRAFEAKAHAADAVTLRRADEAAKVPGRTVPSLDTWLPALEQAVAAR